MIYIALSKEVRARSGRRQEKAGVALSTPPSPWPIHPHFFKEREQMSKRIVAQVVRVIAVLATLALCGSTSNPAWTASHDFSSGEQFVPMFPDQVFTLADTEDRDLQAP